MNPTATPLTDYQLCSATQYFTLEGDPIIGITQDPNGEWVSSAFARQLETELAQAKLDQARLDWLLGALDYDSRMNIGINFRNPRESIDRAMKGQP